MKGSAKVIQVMNRTLKAELTAINQYFCHAEMCDNWGYKYLAKKIKEHAIGEMKHAEALIERILFLDGAPNMADYMKIRIGAAVKQQLDNDLALELEAIPNLNDGIAACVSVGDNGSRELLERILKDEEEHVDWLEAQLHMIGEMGYQNYLSEQMKAE